eukprot:403355371
MEANLKEKSDKYSQKSKNKQYSLVQDNKNFTLQKVFKNFLLLDPTNRRIYCKHVIDEIEQEIESIRSDSRQDQQISQLNQRQLNFYLNVFKRFAFECPIRDISDEFYRVLVKYHKLPLSKVTNQEDEISTFYKLEEVPKIFETPLELSTQDDTNSFDSNFEVRRKDSMFNSRERTMSGSSLKFDNDGEIDLQQLLTDIFITNGRLLHHERVLCHFPSYLSLSFKIRNELMNTQNILPVTHRYYLSIMAVSCYNCEYLLKIQEEQFILNGGDPEWLQKGLKAVDPKLAHIAALNEMIAHKPWAIDSNQIEIDLPLNFDLHTKRQSLSSQKLQELNNSQQPSSKKVSFLIEEDKQKSLPTIMESTSEDYYTTDSNIVEDSSEETQQIKLIEIENFMMNNDKFLMTSDFSWDMNAFEILQQFAPEIIENIDQIFRLMFQNEYQFTEDLDDRIDSQFVLDCICMYLKRIFGIDESESYDYQVINKVFAREFKEYIKKIACYPQLINKDIYVVAEKINVTKLKTGTPSPDKIEKLKLNVKDKLFLNIAAVESKRQISLLFMSKAISDHMRS